jgi:hypothetical protein
MKQIDQVLDGVIERDPAKTAANSPQDRPA